MQDASDLLILGCHSQVPRNAPRQGRVERGCNVQPRDLNSPQTAMFDRGAPKYILNTVAFARDLLSSPVGRSRLRTSAGLRSG